MNDAPKNAKSAKPAPGQAGLELGEAAAGCEPRSVDPAPDPIWSCLRRCAASSIKNPERPRGTHRQPGIEMGGRLTSDPNRSSLGLLPSGPDPVGEWLVHCQSPGPIWGQSRQKASAGAKLLLRLSPDYVTGIAYVPLADIRLDAPPAT